MPGPTPVSAKELEDAVDTLRRSASYFAASSFAGRTLQSARGILADLHRLTQSQERNRRAGTKLDDVG